MRFDTNVSIKIKDAYAARHEPEAERFLGSVYWAFLVVALVLMLVGGIGFGVREFVRPIASDSDTTTARKAKTVSKKDLDAVLTDFDERAKEYDTRKIAPVLVRDPS